MIYALFMSEALLSASRNVWGLAKVLCCVALNAMQGAYIYMILVSLADKLHGL